MRRSGWCATNKPILEQPIVFFGSEGEVGVVARDFYDYLWLLAAGIGPCEAVIGAEDQREPITHFVAFAGKHAAAQRKTATEVLTAAHSEFPGFENIRGDHRHGPATDTTGKLV
jgi:hypothetical protein